MAIPIRRPVPFSTGLPLPSRIGSVPPSGMKLKPFESGLPSSKPKAIAPGLNPAVVAGNVAAAMPAAEKRNGFNMTTGAISPTAPGLPKPTAPAVTLPPPGLSPAKKFAAGMDRQKQINQGVTASLGLQVDRAGNQTGRMPSTPAAAAPPAAPATPSAGLPRPPLLAAANHAPAGYSAGDVTAGATGLSPRRSLMTDPPMEAAAGGLSSPMAATGERLGTTKPGLPSRASQAATGERLGTMQMSGGGKGMRAEDNPEAFAKFAADKTGGLEWKNDVNGPKRGRRVVGGPYNGMTVEQVQAKLAEEFQRQ